MNNNSTETKAGILWLAREMQANLEGNGRGGA